MATDKTEPGNRFIANYPPFSFWSADQLPAIREAFRKKASDTNRLGLYLHIPFCRKRCKFCYFRVYTDKNARDVAQYIDLLRRELDLLAMLPCNDRRKVDFVYFGGGTPSYLNVDQLRTLIEGVKKAFPWDEAREVAFECEPGTLQKHKLEALKELGVTRLSLGVENFDADILQNNGRAHSVAEIPRAYEWAREVGFDQINIDLIAGMIGETDATWKKTVDSALALQPDSLTLYQLELPFNTVFTKELTGKTLPMAGDSLEVADWPTKRRWHEEAFAAFLATGYEISSAYTVVKSTSRMKFHYRDELWHGADMFGTGVASFGYMNGVHYQNHDRWEDYVASLERGELPLARAFATNDQERLIREMILQLKTGHIERAYFLDKFGTDILAEWRSQFAALEGEKLLKVTGEAIRLTTEGLLRVDEFLPRFFESKYQTSRMT